jgi:predicted dithiol-disulfide oxidoreductase (DUF899 family)
VCARSPIERVAKFAKSRGWRDLSLVSSANNTYNIDYHAEDDHGDQLPAINVFVRRNGRIHHFYFTELIFTKPDAKGQDPRPLDIVWPLWNVLDMTPEGRGEDWLPSVSYT